MKKISRIFFLFVACIMPILTGALHTYVHFSDLIRSEIREYLQKEFVYSGVAQPLWNGWGIISFMMGMSFIVIGLLNLSVFNRTPKNSVIPVLPIIAMIIYQLSVVYVGYEFNGIIQFYGGIFGLILISISLILTLKNKEQ